MPAVLLVLLLVSGSVSALEPETVSVVGRVEINPKNAAAARDQALRVALLEAALEVAWRIVPPEVMLWEGERIREAFEAEAGGFVMTYRVTGPVGARPSPEIPDRQEFVLGLSATVDVARVRERLRSLGVLREGKDRASFVLRVRQPVAGAAVSPAPLTAFAHELTRRLQVAGLVAVDPALRAAGPGYSKSTLELARVLGADLAIDVSARWQPRDSQASIPGGLAEVRVQARRTQDGSEVALSRFDAPAYHGDPDEAFARALEAVQPQVAENLILQLERNWRVLAQESGPVQIRLVNATTMLQVEAVQETLRGALGAQEASLVTLGPWAAEITVRGPLSPGALQDRLVASVFDGFRLHPIEVSQSRVELRVERLPGTAHEPTVPVSGRR